ETRGLRESRTSGSRGPIRLEHLRELARLVLLRRRGGRNDRGASAARLEHAREFAGTGGRRRRGGPIACRGSRVQRRIERACEFVRARGLRRRRWRRNGGGRQRRLNRR